VTLALAGCAAGPDSLTTETVASVTGLDVTDEGVGLRTVAVPFSPEGYPVGAALPITMVVVNETDQPVSLVTVVSAAAATVTLADPAAAEVPANGYRNAMVTLEGLRQEVGVLDTVPLELAFDNGASFQLDVPVVPPLERVGEREPVVEPESH